MTVQARNLGSSIRVSWTHDESGPPTQHNVEAETPAGSDNWAPVAQVPHVGGQTNYSYDHDATVSASIRYRVSSQSSAGASAWVMSNIVTPVQVPNAPGDVSAAEQ